MSIERWQTAWRDLIAPGYRLIAGYLLPFREALYPLAFSSAALLTGKVALDVARGVLPDGKPIGLTANSFTSVSLDPPLLLVCIMCTCR